MPAVTDETFGAWLLRCSLKTFDLHAGIEEHGWTRITTWSVNRGYRARRMAPGDRVLLWVAGDSSVMVRGVWGVGVVTGPAHDVLPDDLTTDEDIGLWLDSDARRRVDFAVGTDIELLLDEPVSDEFLQAHGVTDWEVQVQPQIANPSFLTKDQVARFEDLWGDELPAPSSAPTESDKTVTVGQTGAGFGSPVHNRVVEMAAMQATRNWYEQYDGWTVTDVSTVKVGWDLTCTGPAGQVDHVEVKGVSGDRTCVLLTANELRAAREVDGWKLVVVTHAISMPEVSEFDAAQVIDTAAPYVFRADLT